MIYLDNSATTKPHEEVAKKIFEMNCEIFGNPSSFHKIGLDANKELTNARSAVAKALSCESDEIIFTSGATEANNLAIFSAVKTNRHKGKKIVSTLVEHESVFQTMKHLEEDGFEVVYLKPDKFGKISKDKIKEAVDKNTILVSIMFVNNEVGAINDVFDIKNIVKEVNSPAFIHVDCVQAFGKIEVNTKKLGADFVSVSAHKIHASKGVGALYINKNAQSKFKPRTFGGEQEWRLRPGTQAVSLIAGFGVACDKIDLNNFEKAKALTSHLKDELTKINGVKINSADDASPYIVNFYVPTFMTSQTIVQHLSSKYEICVSNGSACAKGKKSHVLTAMNLAPKVIERSIRVSVSEYTTLDEIDAFIKAIKDIVKEYPA